MLVALRVQSFILIESLELRLEPGFNVLTGETGAGKSIIIGALNLVLGGRARADMVRPGAKEACVEALFDLTGAPRVRKQLDEMGVAYDGDQELGVRRIVLPNGRSRAYLNGRLCTVSELASLAITLADVTSQHASVALTDPSRHLEHLDRYGKLTDMRDALGEVVDDLREVVEEINALHAIERGRNERESFLRYQLETIDAIAPEAGELDMLEAECSRLKHASRLSETTARIATTLDTGNLDGGDGLLDQLGKLLGYLEGAAKLDTALSPMADELDDCWSRLRDVARDVAQYAESIEADPERLAVVQDRIYRLGELLRRHGPTIDDVLTARHTAQQELDTLASADGRLVELEEQKATMLTDAARAAERLSKRRKRAATKLGKAISAELGALGMGTARVLIEVTNLRARSDGDLMVGDTRLGRDGIDRAQFLIAPNKGVDPRPLRRIASGGELSRALLALKRALGALEGTSALQVFDEVDAGVGGETADRIGRAIADIARHRQVLCITHLASIAAHADAHFVVHKQHDQATTISTITRVDGPSRVTEMARMLTGAQVSGPSKRAAKELLAAASMSDAAE